MGVLAEYLKIESEQLKAEAENRRTSIEEWLHAVDELFVQCKVWIRNADGGLGVLLAGGMREEFVQEPRLGGYSAKILTIDLAGREAFVAPRARYVAAKVRPPGRDLRRADGMVELRNGTIAEYYLFRWKTDTGDEWFIRGVTEWNQAKDYGVVEPLDSDRFEAAVLRILQ